MHLIQSLLAFAIIIFPILLRAQVPSVTIRVEKLITPLTENELEIIKDVIDDYPEDIIFDCTRAGYSGIWNNLNQICEFDQTKCKNSTKILCRSKFYGKGICAKQEGFNHRKCLEAADITNDNQYALFEKMYKSDKGQFQDSELEQLIEICAFNENTNIKKECDDILEWISIINLAYDHLDVKKPVKKEISPIIHYGENDLGDLIEVSPSKNESDFISNNKKNDPITPKLIYTPVTTGISVRETDKTLDHYEVHEHILVNINSESGERIYLILKRDYSILLDSGLENVSYGKSLSIYDPLLDMKLDLISKEIPPLNTELEQCLQIIQDFFQNDINLKDEKWKDFLKMQSELTLKRLAWSYLEGKHNTDSLEKRITELLRDKLSNPKWNNDENGKILSESYSDKFNALPLKKQGNRNFLAMSVGLLADIIIDQEDMKKNSKMTPFLLKVSDILILEILANSQNKEISNFSAIINSKFTTLDRKNKIVKQKEILSTVKRISKNLNDRLESIVNKKCIVEENLHCKLNASNESILKYFMKDIDKISARAISGIMQRLDLDENIESL